MWQALHVSMRTHHQHVVSLQEAEGGALASFTGTMRYSSGLIADQKRTAAALVRVSKMMGKVRSSVVGLVATSLVYA